MASSPKLIAIYNTFDGEELLAGSIKQIRDHVDFILVVSQTISNWGEVYHGGDKLARSLHPLVDKVILYEPSFSIPPARNETKKRQLGIDFALEYGFTHFILLDNDEYYEDFGAAKDLYLQSGKPGSACKLYTYFKLPTLRFETPDGYFVPFIHELKPDTQAGVRHYPFYVDPTRRINEVDVIELPVFMHHFSWVRKDIERKCRNSSAKENIERGTMLQDYYSPEVGPGYYVKDYDKKLIEVNNSFGISLDRRQ